MAWHLLATKLLPESMLTKTCHHMVSLAHNLSNGHLIRNLHISSALWPLCISCFNAGDVLHKEWCLTTEFLDKPSHIIYQFPYAILGPSLTTYFFSRQEWEVDLGQPSKQAGTKNLKIPHFTWTKGWKLQEDNIELRQPPLQYFAIL